MLTGYIVSRNGKDNYECYAAGTNGGFPIGIVPTAPIGKVLGLEWALPVSYNGVSVEGFTFQMATSNTKPREDAMKVIVVEDVSNGGSYQKVLVADTFTISDFTAAACAGCDPLPDVTVVAPQIFNGDCTKAAPTLPGCVYEGSFYVPALTGGATTFTATAYAKDANGAVVTLAPATSTGTTVALLAADMTTNWASELGSGTFTATGNVIVWTGTAVASFSVSIVQS